MKTKKPNNTLTVSIAIVLSLFTAGLAAASNLDLKSNSPEYHFQELTKVKSQINTVCGLGVKCGDSFVANCKATMKPIEDKQQEIKKSWSSEKTAMTKMTDSIRNHSRLNGDEAIRGASSTMKASEKNRLEKKRVEANGNQSKNNNSKIAGGFNANKSCERLTSKLSNLDGQIKNLLQKVDDSLASGQEMAKRDLSDQADRLTRRRENLQTIKHSPARD